MNRAGTRITAVLAVMAAAAFAASAIAASSPPPMKLTAKGKTVVATQGSYCWHENGEGLCADFRFPPAVRCSLPVKAGKKLVVDFGAPASSAGVNLVAPDGRLRGELPQWKGGNADGSQRWRFRLTRRAAGSAILFAYARYPQGDSSTSTGLASDACRDADFPAP